jgi:oxygen-independent coproporphyrinogen-3 oxidase
VGEPIDQKKPGGKPGIGDGLVRAVYVHAPFCARRCVYCDFAVTVSPTGDLRGWLRALRSEMTFLEQERRFPLAGVLATVFVGGGTPSLLGPHAMRGLAGVLGQERLSDPELEWTAEANPESFNRDVAGGWARAGVNRVSLGAQSFQEAALRWMGRLHGPEGPGEAVRRAREVGIRNISLDLIFGLPGGVERDWGRDLDSALALEVPHLSLYGLSVESGTALGRRVGGGRESPGDETRYREEFLLASERLVGAGYRQYELSNFARPGFESRHNRTYWELRPYLGLGNSAHSYRFPLRRWNLRDWGEYQRATLQGSSPVEGQEELTSGAARLEALWLRLRTDSGIPVAELSPEGIALTRRWIERGDAVSASGSLRLTPKGWLLLDRLTLELDAVEHPGSASS